LEALGITHIVSVLKYDFKDFEDWEKYGHCSVEVDDVEDENLLGEFGRTNKFIGDALKGGGKVLVHW
jgi:dual specificity phosphatase 12